VASTEPLALSVFPRSTSPHMLLLQGFCQSRFQIARLVSILSMSDAIVIHFCNIVLSDCKAFVNFKHARCDNHTLLLYQSVRLSFLIILEKSLGLKWIKNHSISCTEVYTELTFSVF
jgi:hypothetical protein